MLLTVDAKSYPVVMVNLAVFPFSSMIKAEDLDEMESILFWGFG